MMDLLGLRVVGAVRVAGILLGLLSMAGWGELPTNNQCTQNSESPNCPCPTPASDAGINCAWVKINAGPLRPGSTIRDALFRMGEDSLSEASYTPQTLSFVAGYAMKGVSHEVTAADAPRQVTLVNPGGVPFAFAFKDGESIGVPLADSGWALNLRLFMVDANGWSTLQEPAYYDLYTTDGDLFRFNACKTSPQYMQMVLHRTRAGREETYLDLGIEVVRDASSCLRQVLLPSRLADIVMTGARQYEVRFYTLASLAGGRDASGCYQLNAQSEPFETWRFGNPEPATLRRLQVVRVSGGRSKVYDFTWNPDSDTWTLATGDGSTVVRTESRETSWNDARTERLETRTVRDAAGAVVKRFSERIRNVGGLGGVGVTLRVTDPGGANLTNTFTYNAAGLTESAVEPDGSWRYFKYDAAGRVTNELAAVMDSTLTSAAGAAHAVSRDFTPVDPLDTPLLSDKLPRTVTETVLGTVVSRTYRAYRKGSNGELQEVGENAVDPSAGYGDARNLRTIKTYYGTNTVNRQIGRLAGASGFVGGFFEPKA